VRVTRQSLPVLPVATLLSSVPPPCRRPPEIEKKVKQREKNRSAEETDIKKGKTENRSEKYKEMD
jgi:hypothetical protein